MTIPPKLKRPDATMIRHLQLAWTQAGREKLDQHLAVEREQRVFELALTTDPTAEGKYHGWLSAWRRRQWQVQGLRHVFGIEELEQVRDGLRYFHEIRPHLPQEARDVGRYAGSKELFAASAFLTDIGDNRLKSIRKKEALAGSEMLFELGTWKLVRLRTRTAAAWWGMGTRWCTAARTANRFEQYALTGDLLVLITPIGRYQLHTRSCEFRDAGDIRADPHEVLAAAPVGLRLAFFERIGQR